MCHGNKICMKKEINKSNKRRKSSVALFKQEHLLFLNIPCAKEATTEPSKFKAACTF